MGFFLCSLYPLRNILLFFQFRFIIKDGKIVDLPNHNNEEMFFSRKVKPMYRCVLDVDSHAIRVLIFEVPKSGEMPKIIKKMGVELRLASGGTRTVAKIRELLFAALKTLERVPECVVVGLGPSIARSQFESWKKDFPAPGRNISKKELAGEFRALFREEQRKRNLLSAEPIAIEANGYPVSPETLLRAPIEHLLFRVFSISLEKEVGNQFENIKKIFGGMPLVFVPVAVALAESIGVLENISDALIVEINDAETSLILVKKGKFDAFSVFSFGSAHFMRRVGARRGVLREGAREMIRQASYGLTIASEKQKTADLLLTAFESWKKNFSEALDSFYIHGPLSGDVLLAGEGAYILPIRSYFAGEEWLETISYAARPRLRILEASSLFGGASFDGILQGPEDARIAALLRYSMFHKDILS